MKEQTLKIYQDMVVERHKIWERRQNNEAPPWTEDPVLKNLKMTNMFRVLDPGSQFVFELDHTDPMTKIARLVFYRTTNLPETWYAVREAIGRFPEVADFLEGADNLHSALITRKEAGHRIFSGAYIILPEPGTKNDKVEGAIRLTQRFIYEHADDFLAAESTSEQFSVLMSNPGLGPFLSMQIVTDWGYLGEQEPDSSFVVAGPGARRGAALLNPDVSAETVIHDLTTRWQDHPTVRLSDRPLTTMDVQNTMCELSKYHRELQSPRKKSVYRPAHPGPQSAPILPEWW